MARKAATSSNRVRRGGNLRLAACAAMVAPMARRSATPAAWAAARTRRTTTSPSATGCRPRSPRPGWPSTAASAFPSGADMPSSLRWARRTLWRIELDAALNVIAREEVAVVKSAGPAYPRRAPGPRRLALSADRRRTHAAHRSQALISAASGPARRDNAIRRSTTLTAQGPTTWPSRFSTCSRSASARAARTPSGRCARRGCSRCACSMTGCWRAPRGVQCDLYGSLGATGKGHGSDKAVLLGLAGHEPDTVDVEAIPALLKAVRDSGRLHAGRQRTRSLSPRSATCCSTAANRCRCMPTACASRPSMPAAPTLASRVYYSVGGGFVVSDEVAADGSRHKAIAPDTTVLPLPFHSGADLLQITQREGCSIAMVMRTQRKALAQRCRDRRRAAEDLAGDAGLRASAAARPRARCPAASRSSAARRSCTAT